MESTTAAGVRSPSGDGPPAPTLPAPFATFADAVRAVMDHLTDTGAVPQWAVFRTSPDHGGNLVVDAAGERPIVMRAGDVVPWSTSFCRRTIEQDVRVVPSAADDPAFASLPFVSSGRIGAYVGVPIGMPAGEGAYGTLCGFDARARSSDDLEAVLPLLELCSRLLATLLEREEQARDAGALAVRMREAALRDQLTGLGNRRRWSELVVDHAGRRALGVLVADLDGFKAINDEHGHVHGDLVLRRAAECVVEAVRPQDVAVRLGGDEIAVLLAGCRPGEAEGIAGRVREALTAAGIRASVGTAVRQGRESVDEVLDAADAAMYGHKPQDPGRDAHHARDAGADPTP